MGNPAASNIKRACLNFRARLFRERLRNQFRDPLELWLAVTEVRLKAPAGAGCELSDLVSLSRPAKAGLDLPAKLTQHLPSPLSASGRAGL